jgi:hypothetical protein
MAAPVVVNGDTSLVLVNTRNLTAGQSAVILLSSISYPGRTVTVRDSVGFLSSPQTIVISTQNNILFADGTSSVVITQPFGYLTVTSRDPYSWNFKNSFAFPLNQTIANVNSLTTNSVTTDNVYSQLYMSTPYLNTASLTATSTAAVYGPAYASTLIVGPPVLTSNLLVTDPGFTLYSQGSMKVFGNMDIEGAGRFTGSLSTGSNLFVLGTISSLGAFGARGDIMTLGNFIAANGSVIANNLDVRGTTSIGGPATFSNSLVIGSNLSVKNSVSSVYFTTSSLEITSSISFNEKYITYRGRDLLFSDAITVPSISSLNITASNGVLTSNLTVNTTIQAPTLTTLELGSAVITNAAGSLTISSVTANTGNFSNSISTTQFQTSSMTASTILLTGNIDAPFGGYFNINTIVASSLSTAILYADTVQATNFTTTALSISHLNVTSSFVADNVVSFSMSNTAINNSGGTISTGSLYINNLAATSTITNTSGQFTTTSGNIRFVASNVYMDAATISTVATSSITASTLTASRITIGAAPTVGINGPSFVADNILYPSTHSIATGGPGDYLTPYLVSNVKPAGINPGDPYTVQMSFALNFNGPSLPGYYATVLGFNLYPEGEADCAISIRTNNDTENLITLYGLYGTNQSYSTPPNTGGIPLPTGTLPSSFIHVVGTMYGNSAFSLQFQSRSNDNFSAIDSNNTVTINNGVLRWPYSLNGTTIQNSLNDMSIRNIYYYGGLNFASDPSLKEDIHSADLDKCYTTVRDLPLRRFKYIDAYLSTFQQKDTHRLGFIATELETAFPKSVTYTHLEVPGFQSTFRMIDTQQIDMAHIGATQRLMQRVDTLYTTLADMKSEISTLYASYQP